MATEYDLMLFEQHFQATLALPAARRWSLERDESVPLGILCTMHPRTAPAELYKVRLRWTDYTMPFSLKFVNTENGSESDQRAWPNIDGSRPSHFFVCAPYTKEGNDYHPEWALSLANCYKTPDEPLAFALIQIQHLLDNTYQGRA